MTIKPIIPITGALVGYLVTVAYTKRYTGSLLLVGTLTGAVLGVVFSSYYFLPKSANELLKSEEQEKTKK